MTAGIPWNVAEAYEPWHQDWSRRPVSDMVDDTERATLEDLDQWVGWVSEEALCVVLARVQAEVLRRNTVDPRPGPGRPWAQLRRELVAQWPTEPRLQLTFDEHGPGCRADLSTFGVGAPLERGRVSLSSVASREARREALIHELLHWQRGTAAADCEHQERAEEVVVAALTAERLRLVESRDGGT